MSTVIYDFDWDPAKARSNQQKHGVSFRLATTVLRDPMALTIYDEEHSNEEDRWVTLGQAENGQLLVVVHTWACIEPTEVKVRIISARRADPGETRDYQDAPH
jgi:uncharacterized DUF497 family protein